MCKLRVLAYWHFLLRPSRALIFCNHPGYLACKATVRYADDFVCCFEFEEDARRFYVALEKRLAKFNLELAADKSQIIAFGKKAEAEAKANGLPKPGTFDFLGFTHYCGKSRHGKFRVKRKTCRKNSKLV